MLQGHYYATSVQSVLNPATNGKVVLLETQLKAVGTLQAYADIHPIVIGIVADDPAELVKVLPEGTTLMVMTGG